MTDRSPIRREIRISASPQTVFAFLTDPSKIVRWHGVLAQLDPRPGGAFRVQFNSRDVVSGRYLEIVPASRAVFTWGWEGSGTVPPGSSTVEITLTPDGDGTIVTLEHRDLPEAARDQHAQGWELYLDRLAVAATGGEPGPDPNADAGKM